MHVLNSTGCAGCRLEVQYGNRWSWGGSADDKRPIRAGLLVWQSANWLVSLACACVRAERMMVSASTITVS